MTPDATARFPPRSGAHPVRGGRGSAPSQVLPPPPRAAAAGFVRPSGTELAARLGAALTERLVVDAVHEPTVDEVLIEVRIVGEADDAVASEAAFPVAERAARAVQADQRRGALHVALTGQNARLRGARPAAEGGEHATPQRAEERPPGRAPRRELGQPIKPHRIHRAPSSRPQQLTPRSARSIPPGTAATGGEATPPQKQRWPTVPNARCERERAARLTRKSPAAATLCDVDVRQVLRQQILGRARHPGWWPTVSHKGASLLKKSRPGPARPSKRASGVGTGGNPPESLASSRSLPLRLIATPSFSTGWGLSATTGPPAPTRRGAVADHKNQRAVRRSGTTARSEHTSPTHPRDRWGIAVADLRRPARRGPPVPGRRRRATAASARRGHAIRPRSRERRLGIGHRYSPPLDRRPWRGVGAIAAVR